MRGFSDLALNPFGGASQVDCRSAIYGLQSFFRAFQRCRGTSDFPIRPSEFLSDCAIPHGRIRVHDRTTSSSQPNDDCSLRLLDLSILGSGSSLSHGVLPFNPARSPVLATDLSFPPFPISQHRQCFSRVRLPVPPKEQVACQAISAATKIVDPWFYWPFAVYQPRPSDPSESSVKKVFPY